MIEARISSVLDGRQSGDCPQGKGEPPKRFFFPRAISGTQAEYAADCHISGALSVQYI